VHLRVDEEQKRSRFAQYSFGVAPDDPQAKPIFETWSTPTGSYSAVDEGSAFRYVQYPHPVDPPLLTGREAIPIFFPTIENVTVTEVCHDGWVADQIAGVDSVSPSPENDMQVVAVVDSSGMLRELSITGPPERFFWVARPFWLRWNRMSVTIRYEAIGTTTIERPEWVDSEWNSTNT
jgi:hypothetical protein